jgi:hypothetical protein
MPCMDCPKRIALEACAAQSVSRGCGNWAAVIGNCYANCMATVGGDTNRPDVEALVASGYFDLCIEVVEAFAARGVEGLPDVHQHAV